MIQRAIKNNSRPDDQEQSSLEMKEMVETINSKVANAVDYEEVKCLTCNERMALWLAADVFVLTSIREGLNLMPMEYIFARKDLSNAGVVVASEFSTCSSLLNGALKINPFNIQLVADQLDKALNMDMKERTYRRQRDIDFVTTHPSAGWTKQILTDIAHFKTMADKLKRPVTASERHQTSLVDHTLIESAYRASEYEGISDKCRRLFIFDYGGTLLHSEKYDIYIKQSLSAISGRKPTPAMMAALRVLCDDPNNSVMVVTGLTKMKLGSCSFILFIVLTLSVYLCICVYICVPLFYFSSFYLSVYFLSFSSVLYKFFCPSFFLVLTCLILFFLPSQ